ncbi:hypothetical protein PtrV1_00201 [Pyrenophora tritici-repentis]|uniref:Herpes-BLLF1 multi-domain protein n=1 Tax=Pyrenophora tritici-repentis TaxID=45151 RepID=A0A2W1FWW5_9PLEO|nr:hypothetical protein PtrV1_00201 [Pyrenophora tritici-repentis]KAF7575965.1 Herpes-BLLF1 multi-domain protein [Pyrenophora tritici-repentis]KAI0573601.1 hypothetical protein Alg215_09101 [Pyrenophora tritici-repentis]PZD26752.1 hypothetical protein A1F96_07331 [Pyrenophora tritici-repentis]
MSSKCDPSSNLTPLDTSMKPSPNTDETLATPSNSVDHENGETSSLSEDHQHVNASDTTVHKHTRTDTLDPLDDSFSSPSRAKSRKMTQSQPRPQDRSPKIDRLSTSSSLNLPDEKEKSTQVNSTVTATSTAYETAAPKPGKTSIRTHIKMFFIHWFSVYRVLMALVIIVNLVVLAVMIEKNLPYTRFHLAGPLVATAANLFAAVVIRQEEVINTIFRVLAHTPIGLPLWMRKSIADFHHFGGFHIGCAMSSLFWYFFFVYLNTTFFVNGLRESKANGWVWADIITCYSFLISIFLVCVAAHPRFRQRFHNTFERTHRFGGWIALTVLWVNAGVSSHTHGNTPMHRNPTVWLLAVTTFLIILPWLRMSRVPVTATAVSAREVRLTFPYKRMPYTATMRFSLAPLTEWHAFATVPSPQAHPTAYILISQAGDWTTSIIRSPPKEIYIRRPATLNFLALAPLFNSLLLVGTGAGIGPLLSLLSSPAIKRMRDQGRVIRVLWVVYAAEAPHWQFVHDIIRAVDPEPKIFDSQHGRPDVAFETQFLMETEKLEAVMVVSNPAVTRLVVEGVKAKGYPAYGAVFDS